MKKNRKKSAQFKSEEQLINAWAECGEKEKVNPKKKTFRNPYELKKDVVEIICQNGSTWIKRTQFYEEAESIGITESDIKRLFDEGFLVEEAKKNKSVYISTKELKEYEEEIARLLFWHTQKKLVRHHSREEIVTLIDECEKKYGVKLAKEQRMAVIKAINAPVMVITGVAGAGKTTIDKIILDVFRSLGEAKKSCNLAPTGKASKRMQEALGESAETVDKNLTNGMFITEQVAIIDEASFLDTKNLMRFLRKAVRCTHIIFQGDPFQLSSVGCGMVLRDLIDSGVVSVQKLNKSFRVDKKAINIQRNVQLIRDFEASTETTSEEYLADGTKVTVVDKIKNHFSEGNDFHIFADISADEVSKKIVDVYEEKVKKYGRENVCVLIPFRDKRKGKVTSEGFNDSIEKRLFGEEGYHVGSVVMQLENMNFAQNGSIGTITELAGDNITVEFKDGNERTAHTYTKDEAKKWLCLAYGMSVHKSQGSEYDCVILATLEEHKKMLNRNLIYTGITRAKKEVNYFFDSECLHYALSKEASEIRVTMLREKLEALIEADKKKKTA